MQILISDVNESHANACKSRIEEECPTAIVTTRLESLSASVTYAIANGYEIISRSTTGLSDSTNENEGDTAWAGGEFSEFSDEFSDEFGELIKVGIVHAHGSNSHIRLSQPSGLDIICAVGAGDGDGNNRNSYGPGLEFFNDEETTESYATARIAGIIGQLMIDHPTWNFHDARAALRQTASFYSTGWVEDGGYGAVNKTLANAVSTLAMFSPTRTTVVQDSDAQTLTFTWRNALQSGITSSIIARYVSSPDRDAIPTQGNALILYNGLLETYEYDYSNTFLGTFYFVFHTAGSYSLIESFDMTEVITGVMAEFIKLTSSITKIIRLTSHIDMGEV